MSKTEKRRFDSAYKSLFSNPRILCQLVNSFVDEDFASNLKAEDIRRLEKSSFVTDEFINREADMIYHVRKGERDLYFYILLEFQSVPDKRMPVRLFSYLFLFYEQLIKHSQKGLLPPVFPMVLYNGEKNWNVPLNVQDLIVKGIFPECYIPQCRFFLLDESKVPDDKLREVNNLAAAVLYFEKHKQDEDISHVLFNMMNLLRDEDFNDVRKLLYWVGRIGRISFRSEDIDKLNNIDEGNEMIGSSWQRSIDREAKKRAVKMAEELALKMAEERTEEKVITIARSMKAKGFENRVIVELTGLKEEEVEKL